MTQCHQKVKMGLWMVPLLLHWLQSICLGPYCLCHRNHLMLSNQSEVATWVTHHSNEIYFKIPHKVRTHEWLDSVGMYYIYKAGICAEQNNNPRNNAEKIYASVREGNDLSKYIPPIKGLSQWCWNLQQWLSWNSGEWLVQLEGEQPACIVLIAI